MTITIGDKTYILCDVRVEIEPLVVDTTKFGEEIREKEALGRVLTLRGVIVENEQRSAKHG